MRSLGLLGPNGSGKTTTLKMLLSLLHPSKGKCFMLGGNTRDTKICSQIGYLPEESYLYKYLSAKETLEFYARIFGLPRSIRKTRIDNLLEMVGLAGMANRPVGTYSKGMARRIGLAQALINDPEVLVLDEPTSGMDPLGTRQMKDLIMELGKRGKTVLLCSHLLADVEDVCDRIGIMYGGKMQVEGPVTSLLTKTNTRQITTGIVSESALDRIKEIIKAENQDCQITEPMDRLEEFFIRTVDAAQQKQQPTSGRSARQKPMFISWKRNAKPTCLKNLSRLNQSRFRKPPKSLMTRTLRLPSLENVKEIEQPKSSVLEELTSKPKPSETQTTHKVETDQPKQIETNKVRHDVLNDLLGSNPDQSQTEITHPESEKDSKDD